MPRNPVTLDTPLRSLFPADVRVAELTGEAGMQDLLPEEAVAVSAAVASRVQQFAAGRLCARRALLELTGRAPAALCAGPDRVPIWPAETTGSITHTEGLAAAAVGARAVFRGLGLDVEPRTAVKDHLWPAICVAEELAWLGALPAERAREAATLLFCAKEAFYKAQYAVTAEWVGFKDVRVGFEPEGDGRGCFTVEALRELKVMRQLADMPRGRYLLHGGFASAGLALPAQ